MASPPDTRFAVRLRPRAGADRIDGVLDGVLQVRVAAAPIDGAANEALVRLVAGALGVAPSRVRVAVGASSRHKVVEVAAADPARLRSVWAGLDV